MHAETDNKEEYTRLTEYSLRPIGGTGHRKMELRIILDDMMIILYCQIKSEMFLASQQLHLQHHRKDKNSDKKQIYQYLP